MIQINRIDPITNKNWNPKSHDRVCSNHFEECAPTEKCPYPSVNLGHNVKTTVRPSRKMILKHNIQKKLEDIKIYTTTPYIDFVKTSSQSDHCYTGNKDKKSTGKLQSDTNHTDHTESDHTYAGKCDCSPNCACIEAYGGRASGRFIVMDSRFLNLIDPTDEVMADRSFPIQSDLVMRQAKLIIPPPGHGSEQMTKENVLKTKAVANVRIHVERAISRIKCFKILKNTLPITLVPLANEIFTICSAVSNLQPPLVK
ncbi:unnamed protein product [Mytilus coruscus]|uniref:DDE Tnp4 domain-containing protein n=1 Tax=Mytilus coruscus TaxID=42192 RepID=A0A6J8DYG0_MYTCO|nr:unnamed protein product [Mytilus coruscus]